MKQWCSAQLNYFLLALAFFTRIPIPASTPYSAERLNHASRYFAAVGLIIGLICGGTLWIFTMLLPSSSAIVISMVFGLLLTGAFHEDGLADMCDGLGGGLDRERKLVIMKDSRIGSYGAITLIMALLLKFTLLQGLAGSGVSTAVLALLVMHPLSRALSGSLIFDMSYVRDEETGKSKPLANNQQPSDLLCLLATAALLLLLLSPLAASLLILLLFAFRQSFRRWLQGHIGGYTGDCLGAAQQLSELLGYLLFAALQYHQLPLFSPLINTITGG